MEINPSGLKRGTAQFCLILYGKINKMRFPSLQLIYDQTTKVIYRFPVEIFVAVFGTAVALLLTKEPSPDLEQSLIKLLLVSVLAFSSSMAITISAEYHGFQPVKKWLAYGVLAVLLLIFHQSFGKEIQVKDGIRFAHLLVTAHLLVAVAPFAGRGSTDAFWQYNRILFLRIITAGIFSGVLFAGLGGAIAALDALFTLDLNEFWYPRTFILVAGLFSTVFFMSGIPRKAEQLEHEKEYPLVLKIFTQYVLVPLVFIYLAILLAYEIKIAFEWSLPNGWVSNLIIAFAIAGILSILLVYPIRNNNESKWVKVFAKWFYLLLIPLVILMFIAIGKRISDYGFTEERVIVFATACWLAFLTLLFIVRPKTDIRIIPLSLALIAFVLQFIVFRLSETDQQKRLNELLSKNELLKDGKAVKKPAGKVIPEKDVESIESIFQYLANMHGKESVEPLLPITEKDLKNTSVYSVVNKKLDSLNYISYDHIIQAKNILRLQAQPGKIRTASFDYVMQIKTGTEKTNDVNMVKREDGKYQLYVDGAPIPVLLSAEDWFNPGVIDPEREFERTLPQDQMKQRVETGSYILEIYFTEASLKKLGNKFAYEYAQGIVLIREKP